MLMTDTVKNGNENIHSNGNESIHSNGKENLTNEKKEKYEFEAEVPQVMSIIINSVYSTKELFLRELVSNAADALTKLMKQRQSLEEEGYKTGATCNYKIEIIPDQDNKTLTIRDNGVGMKKTDLINFLGSIASSGTKKFREAMEAGKGTANMESLIGQFGLGFYSAFLVANRVDVITKHPKDSAYFWSSEGAVGYTIEELDEAQMSNMQLGDTKEQESLTNGTSVILWLKDGEEEYLKIDRLTELVKKHSQFIPYSIYLLSLEAPEKKVEEENKIEEEKNEDVEEIKDEDTASEKESKDTASEKESKETEEKKCEWKARRLNSKTSNWNKNVKDIPDEDLKELYGTLSNDYTKEYAAVQSWHFEGAIDINLILFIPKRAPFNLFDANSQNSKFANNIKVVCSNVFVTDEISREVVPEWASCVVGVVSSSDFSMSVSREVLQGKAALNHLKKQLPKCILEMLQKLSRDQKAFDAFYKEFSPNLKMAARATSDKQQEAFLKLLRYKTNKGTTLTLDEYLKEVPETQKQIYVLTGLSRNDVESSLYLEAYKDTTVLLMDEPADEIMLQGLTAYQGLNFQRISSEEGKEEGERKEDESYADFKKDVQEHLKDKVERVEITTRFSTVPVMLLTTKWASSPAMENIIMSQPNAKNNPLAMMMMNSKKIFDINVENPVVKYVIGLHKEGKKEEMKKYIDFLYSSALVGGGFVVENKKDFILQLYEILGSMIVQGK